MHRHLVMIVALSAIVSACAVNDSGAMSDSVCAELGGVVEAIATPEGDTRQLCTVGGQPPAEHPDSSPDPGEASGASTQDLMPVVFSNVTHPQLGTFDNPIPFGTPYLVEFDATSPHTSASYSAAITFQIFEPTPVSYLAIPKDPATDGYRFATVPMRARLETLDGLPSLDGYSLIPDPAVIDANGLGSSRVICSLLELNSLQRSGSLHAGDLVEGDNCTEIPQEVVEPLGGARVQIVVPGGASYFWGHTG